MHKRNKTIQYAIGELKYSTKAIDSANKSDFAPKTIIIGVSGGADSLALACIVSIAYQQYNIKVVIIDHGLQNNSDIVAKNAGNEVAKLGLKYIIKQANIAKATNLEAVARDARYQLLLDECSSGDILLLAHTIDDQAETVLLNIARSSGTHALTGMSNIVRTNNGIVIVRPFMRNITRKMTEEICNEFGLDFWNDPTNFIDNNSTIPTPKRTLVRHKLLPVYDEIFPGIKQNLSRTAMLNANDDDCLNIIADEAYSRAIAPDFTLDRSILINAHIAIRYRVIRKWLQTSGYNHQITAERIIEIDEKLILINGSGGSTIELEDSYQITRKGATLTLNQR